MQIEEGRNLDLGLCIGLNPFLRNFESAIAELLLNTVTES